MPNSPPPNLGESDKWPAPAARDAGTPDTDGPPPDVPAVPRPRGAAAWPPWTSLAALFTGLLVTLIGGAIVATAAGIGATEDPPPGVNIGLTLFQNLALVGAALLFARLAGRPTAADFGLRRTPVRRAVKLLVGVWIAFYAFSAVWVLALGIDTKQDLPDRLGADDSTLNLLIVVVLITVVAPLGEELFFRGFFFGALRNWRGVWPAAIATGAIFGVIHAGSAPVGLLVPLAAFGVGLCLLYHFSGSLYPCIALHALNNSIALGATLSWSWEIPVIMAASVVATLAIASQLARLLGGRTAAPAPLHGMT